MLKVGDAAELERDVDNAGSVAGGPAILGDAVAAVSGDVDSFSLGEPVVGDVVEIVPQLEVAALGGLSALELQGSADPCPGDALVPGCLDEASFVEEELVAQLPQDTGRGVRADAGDRRSAPGTTSRRARPARMSVQDESVSHMADTDEAANDVEHAVIAHYRLTEADLGDPSQRETIRQAQSLLTEAIEQADVGEFDGNEYGGGKVALYAYGPNADALFAVMAPILHDLPFRPAHVVLRYGSVDDPSAAERRVDL
ncbi:hypothetical protein [Streptomyces hydrogenans]|uniref:hypothetical protein n=1 Tax=Streptomyces hydrogenans TaxID=1873719 RepID=UPI0035DE29B2